MTQPIQEPTQDRADQALAYRTRQLFRRPATSGGSSQVVLEIKVVADSNLVASGDGQFIFAISSDLNGYDLQSAEAYVTTVSSSGTPTVQIRNVTDAVDMLSTAITIDVSEFTSYTAAVPSVVSVPGVATADLIAVDVDVSGTGTKGLGVILTFGP